MKRTDPSLSIVILNWNSWPDTEKCLASLTKDPFHTRCQLILIENGSTRNAVPEDFAAPSFHSLKVVCQENLGFTGGNNAAAAHVQAPYLLLLNDDTAVPTGTLERLVGFLEGNERYGIAGPRILNADGSVQSAGLRTSLWTATTRAIPPESGADPESVSGCCFCIRTDLWNQLGGFDDRFFAYFEETDLCIRARQIGSDVAVLRDLSITHFGGTSFGPHAERLYARNRFYLVKKHGSFLQKLFFGTYMVFPYTPLRLLLLLIQSPQNIKAYLKGFWEGWIFFLKTMPKGERSSTEKF